MLVVLHRQAAADGQLTGVPLSYPPSQVERILRARYSFTYFYYFYIVGSSLSDNPTSHGVTTLGLLSDDLGGSHGVTTLGEVIHKARTFARVADSGY